MDWLCWVAVDVALFLKQYDLSNRVELMDYLDSIDCSLEDFQAMLYGKQFSIDSNILEVCVWWWTWADIYPIISSVSLPLEALLCSFSLVYQFHFTYRSHDFVALHRYSESYQLGFTYNQSPAWKKTTLIWVMNDKLLCVTIIMT